MAIYTHSQNLTLSNFGLLSGQLAEMKAKFKVQLDVCDIAPLKEEYLLFLKLISVLMAFVHSASDRAYLWVLALLTLLLLAYSSTST